MTDQEFNQMHPRLFMEEPVFLCPDCERALSTEWVDNGFGPYSVRVAPYHCECGWCEIDKE